MDSSARRALVGWLDTTKRLKSTKKDSKRKLLNSERRKLMNRCSRSVPVWIMPIALIFEHFNLSTKRFDVIISTRPVKQASMHCFCSTWESRSSSLVIMSKSRPWGAARTRLSFRTCASRCSKAFRTRIFSTTKRQSMTWLARVLGMRSAWLSTFAVCRTSLRSRISSSYEGKIQPLREASSTHLKPACVARRVHGIRENGMNRIEAEHITLSSRR